MSGSYYNTTLPCIYSQKNKKFPLKSTILKFSLGWVISPSPASVDSPSPLKRLGLKQHLCCKVEPCRGRVGDPCREDGSSLVPGSFVPCNFGRPLRHGHRHLMLCGVVFMGFCLSFNYYCRKVCKKVM